MHHNLKEEKKFKKFAIFSYGVGKQGFFQHKVPFSVGIKKREN